jgi:hypothetical protein
VVDSGPLPGDGRTNFARVAEPGGPGSFWNDFCQIGTIVVDARERACSSHTPGFAHSLCGLRNICASPRNILLFYAAFVFEKHRFPGDPRKHVGNCGRFGASPGGRPYKFCGDGGHMFTHVHTRSHTRSHVHTHVHTHVHVFTHTFTHVHTRSHTRSHTFTHVRTRSHTFTHSFTHVHTHTFTHVQTHTHTRSHMFSRVHTHTHTFSHTFTHVHMFTHVRTRAHVHTHVHTHTHTH